MEWNKEVKEAIGPHNYNLLLEEVRKGVLTLQHMKDIAMKMHPHVHGTFVQHERVEDRCFLMRILLDKWYLTVLYKQDIDGAMQLIEILDDKDIGLHVLVLKMKQISNKVPQKNVSQ
eukprot:GFUD01054783.1.p1 GENE.GFUD01054783.1~~GFUD01054783.1.p1  ORF type:complete len:117 (+),score=8.52 GFUD01054783.1:68-418(+)